MTTKTKLPYGAQVETTPFGLRIAFPNGGDVPTNVYRSLQKWGFRREYVTRHWLIADTPENRVIAEDIKELYNLRYTN